MPPMARHSSTDSSSEACAWRGWSRLTTATEPSHLSAYACAQPIAELERHREEVSGEVGGTVEVADELRQRDGAF
jgi:hypothetical protein